MMRIGNFSIEFRQTTEMGHIALVPAGTPAGDMALTVCGQQQLVLGRREGWHPTNEELVGVCGECFLPFEEIINYAAEGRRREEVIQ